MRAASPPSGVLANGSRRRNSPDEPPAESVQNAPRPWWLPIWLQLESDARGARSPRSVQLCRLSVHRRAVSFPGGTRHTAIPDAQRRGLPAVRLVLMGLSVL